MDRGSARLDLLVLFFLSSLKRGTVSKDGSQFMALSFLSYLKRGTVSKDGSDSLCVLVIVGQFEMFDPCILILS